MSDRRRPSAPAPRRYRRRTLALVCAALLTIVCGASTGSAGAVTFGSDLSQTANLPFGCNARPYPGLGGMQLLATGVSTCMWWPAPLTAASTYVPRGEGRVIGARVRSGPNPAPLRISIISSGGGLCCTSRSTSAVFQPQPNAVTSVALDLPAGSGIDPNRAGSQYNDIVAVSAVGPGSLPVHDYGAHNTFNTSIPAAAFLHPELTNGNSNTDVGWMDGYEVLLQVDWCGVAGVASTRRGGVAASPGTASVAARDGTRARAAADCPSPAPPSQPQTPQTPQTPTPTKGAAAPRLSSLTTRGRTVRVRVSAPARVTARLQRCTVQQRPRRRTVCRLTATLRGRATRATTLSLAVPPSVPAGRYRVTISATAGAKPLVRTLVLPKPPTRRSR